MRTRAAALFVLTTLGISLLALVAPAAPAWACSCVGSGEDARADLIVVGTVTTVTDNAIRLAVESVEKGRPVTWANLELAVGRDEMSCGFDFRTGNRYRVNSAKGRTGLCAGIRPLPAKPSAPSPSAGSEGVTASPATDQAPRRRWLAAGTVITVLGVGSVVIVRRRLRRM